MSARARAFMSLRIGQSIVEARDQIAEIFPVHTATSRIGRKLPW